MLDWILLLAILPVAALAFLRWFEQRNVYHPTSTWDATADALGRPWEAVRFPARDGADLSGWFFPADPASPRRHLAVLLHHGNGGNISHRLPTCELLLDLGVNVLVYDYRGYGLSPGHPSEAGTYLDAEGAADWLNRRGFTDDRIIALGESLGGGVASELAVRRPGLRGLILQSTFTSLLDLGAELFPFLPVRTVARYHYDTRSKLPRIHRPVLILHSREDTLIPFHHAERNLAAANPPKALREIEGDHNDQPTVAPERFSEAIGQFLDSLEPTPTPRAP